MEPLWYILVIQVCLVLHWYKSHKSVQYFNSCKNYEWLVSYILAFSGWTLVIYSSWVNCTHCNLPTFIFTIENLSWSYMFYCYKTNNMKSSRHSIHSHCWAVRLSHVSGTGLVTWDAGRAPHPHWPTTYLWIHVLSQDYTTVKYRRLNQFTVPHSKLYLG